MSERSEAERAADARTRVREMTPAELTALRARGERLTCIDVRESNEWNLFRIPGALHLPLAKIESAVEGALLNDGSPIVLYCARGNRSAIAADALRERGYGNVASLRGGIMAWIDAGGEVEE